MSKSVHLFFGTFGSIGNALGYTQEQWEPEPGDDVSDEEYSDWEERNPTWALMDDLGLEFMDSDFVETDGLDKMDTYLPTVIPADEYVAVVKPAVRPEYDTMVLILEDAFGGFDYSLSSTKKMDYIGSFRLVSS